MRKNIQNLLKGKLQNITFFQRWEFLRPFGSKRTKFERQIRREMKGNNDENPMLRINNNHGLEIIKIKYNLDNPLEKRTLEKFRDYYLKVRNEMIKKLEDEKN